MDKPLRILSIFDLPWDPRFGASRVWIDLADEWEAAGHTVKKFSLTDACPAPLGSSWLSALRQMSFRRQALRFVRNNASRFDVIDALIGALPFSKKRLGFDGLLVARSVGLHRAYDKFSAFSHRQWPDQPRGKFLGRFFYRFIYHRVHQDREASLRHCDLINLLNSDEIPFLRESPVIEKPFIVEPNGLNEMERTALANAIQPAGVRLQGKEICFVGMWGLRKGSRDWRKIIVRVRSAIPDARFTFLGTMNDSRTVLSDLLLDNSSNIRVVSTFDRKELPVLLRPCAVGIFPSYIEGFGLAVLEQLACAIPTVAYDVAGPRQILQPFGAASLVPCGDAAAIADRAVEILRMTVADYEKLAARCRSRADEFRWDKIASDTAHKYRAALEKLRRSE